MTLPTILRVETFCPSGHPSAEPVTIPDGHKRAAAAHWVATLDAQPKAVGTLTAYVGISPSPAPSAAPENNCPLKPKVY